MISAALLISRIRTQTENLEFTETTGIQDDEILGYLNDAQKTAQSAISNRFPRVFEVETVMNTVANQEAYDIPQDAWLRNRISLIEYSHSGNAEDYMVLKSGVQQERLNGVTYRNPTFYIRRNKQILVQPKPPVSSSKIRMTYEKAVPKLDTRRGKVAAVTLTGSEITSLTLDTTEDIDETAIESEGYCTIVDAYGNVKMRRIPVTDVDANTGIVTVAAGFEFEDGETIAVGDYILKGYDSTTHSQLDDLCEMYLVQYADWKVKKRDSSSDSLEASTELKELLGSIVESYSEPDADVVQVPIINDDFLLTDG